MADGEVGRHQVRVYYEDTDFSGNVYHAQYLKFFERGRTEFLRSRGVHHGELAGERLAFAVTHMEVYFDAAARIDDLLAVETELERTGGARVVLRQTISRGETLRSRATVTVALIDKRGKAVRIPAAMRAQLGG